MGLPKNLRNWRRNTPIAPLMNMMVTLAGSGVVRCRNHLRMLLMDWKLDRSVMWFQPTVVYIWCSGLVELKIDTYSESMHPGKKECICSWRENCQIMGYHPNFKFDSAENCSWAQAWAPETWWAFTTGISRLSASHLIAKKTCRSSMPCNYFIYICSPNYYTTWTP